MPDAQQNELLNDLLVDAYGSLLQYAIECWPWTDPEDEAEQQTIAEMAAAQKAVVARISALLESRGYAIELGQYPDWSSLHFVSLDYLLGKLIADEEQLIAAIEQAQPTLKSDPEASAQAFDLLHMEKKHLARLREMAATRKTHAVA